MEGAKKLSLKDTNILFIGNPGVGKSTLLNSLVGKVVFTAGLSFGSGLTNQLDKWEDEHGNTFMDTPGLSDETLRKQAAEEITKALRAGGNFKIIFVLTLEAGRIRAVDKATMKAVLDAAPILNYGVVINKVTDKVANKLLNEAKELDGDPSSSEPSPLARLLDALYMGIEKKTTYTFPNRFDPELEDEDNVLKPCPDGLLQFIENLPATFLDEGQANEVAADEYERFRKFYEKKLAAMDKDTQMVRRELQGTQALLAISALSNIRWDQAAKMFM